MDDGPPCTVFEADLRSFAFTHREEVPASYFPFAHTLVSSLKYLMTDGDVLAHFAAVHSVLADDGVYVVVFHLADYCASPADSVSVDEYSAERDGVHVHAVITCHPPDRSARTEAVTIRMDVRHADGRTAHYATDELMRTYDRCELWQLLRTLTPSFELISTFDYAHAAEVRIDAPLAWPSSLPSHLQLSSKDEKAVVTEDAAQWPGWDGVEAVALLLRRR